MVGGLTRAERLKRATATTMLTACLALAAASSPAQAQLGEVECLVSQTSSQINNALNAPYAIQQQVHSRIREALRKYDMDCLMSALTLFGGLGRLLSNPFSGLGARICRAVLDGITHNGSPDLQLLRQPERLMALVDVVMREPDGLPAIAQEAGP